LRHPKIQTTLDRYTQEDSDETRAAQGEFLSTVGDDANFEMNGGDDGTRTRGLCRDSTPFVRNLSLAIARVP